MKQLRKDILKEAMHICKESGLYQACTAEEKREAVIHVYNVISEAGLKRDEAIRTA